MKKSFVIALAATAFSATVWAAGADEHSAATSTTTIAQAGDAMAMVDGEVRKVDTEGKKITLKHGEIKNLGMPGMTMVFQVKDPAALGSLKVGDKVRFMAEKQGGAIVVTHIEPAK